MTYYALFGYVRNWLFDDLDESLTRDLAVERAAFFWRMGLYLVFGLLLVAVNVVFDYAKARAVIEDRRSMMGRGCRASSLFAGTPARSRRFDVLDGNLFFVAVIGL